MTSEQNNDILTMELRAGGDDWRPTPHGLFLADVLAKNFFAKGKDVLELGGGVGNHTIILLRQGPRSLVVTEIDDALLASTRANVERNRPQESVIEYRVADWLSTEGSFDLIVTNPPFCVSGKQNRRYYIDSLILDAHQRLRPGGELVFIQSSMADIHKTLRRLDENGFDAEVVERRRGPFRDYYFEDETFMEEIKHVPDGYTVENGTYMETLAVIHGTLRHYSPPAIAHIPATKK